MSHPFSGYNAIHQGMIDNLPRSQLLNQITAWAQAHDGLRAVALVGSGARTDHPADAWSDLDLLLVAVDPEAILASTGWLATFGETWFTFTERWWDGKALERRVLFASGQDVDFMFLAVSTARQGFTDTFIAEIAARGLHVLFDKDGLLASLAAGTPSQPKPLPSNQEFSEVVHDFWYHTVWTAKKLRRGELWVAKSCCDDYLKRMLLSMLAWQAQSRAGGPVDTWFNGRFLEQWASPAALEALRAAFARYDPEDIWRALQVTMDLFDQVARETAGQLGYAYPAEKVEKAMDLVKRIR